MVLSWACGCADYEVLMVRLGQAGQEAVNLAEMGSARYFTKCTQLWKGFNATNKKMITNWNRIEKLRWAYSIAGYTMRGIIASCWKYLHPAGKLPNDFEWPAELKENKVQDDDNKIDFKIQFKKNMVDLTARWYCGDLATTAGTWTPNNYTISPIRAFILSLAYGLDEHPGDEQATTPDVVGAIVHGLAALTSCTSFWVVIFCRQQDVSMVHKALQECKGIRGVPEDLVSQFSTCFSYILLFHLMSYN
jgi:hypothetical protein